GSRVEVVVVPDRAVAGVEAGLAAVAADRLEPGGRAGVREGAVVLGTTEQLPGRVRWVERQRLELDRVQPVVQWRDRRRDPAQQALAVEQVGRSERLRAVAVVVDEAPRRARRG